jgi:hypothetical protein
MTERERRALIEAATTAWRPRDRDGALRAHPAWHDLSEEDRLQVARETMVLRQMEAALAADGLSTTGQVVISRIQGT